ncbi:MAG: hypothetical protein IKB70_10325 [Bacilli bacterium]|nr:hypothetical protein [Bacilli bacterium]
MICVFTFVFMHRGMLYVNYHCLIIYASENDHLLYLAIFKCV